MQPQRLFSTQIIFFHKHLNHPLTISICPILDPRTNGAVVRTDKSLAFTLPRTSMQCGIVKCTVTWIDSTIHVSSRLIIRVTVRTVLADEPSCRQMVLEAEATTNMH
ncbi:hypothetical protein BLNAU_14340 [Blattamonas nauphoetae]|uniref:Uncharacterized protein n=1 Tax=Blattamonas nauphoetae TaxID=2049346 RepID=A0ABQ9XGZ6_9EUKA|nr:hypothetical protein BLNAU_14340 [Blattamonas nauphoetae]